MGDDAAAGKFELSKFALLFDPATNAFTTIGTTQIPRDGDRQIVLQDGRVLVLGGVLDPGNPVCGTPLAPEVYDPATGRFSLVGGVSPASFAMPVLVADGRVLLLGGIKADCATQSRGVERDRLGIASAHPDVHRATGQAETLPEDAHYIDRKLNRLIVHCSRRHEIPFPQN